MVYYYRRSRKEEQVVAVPREEEDRIKGVQGKLGAIWDEYGDTILLAGAAGIILAASIASVCSGGTLAPGALALAAVLILLMQDGAMPEPKRNNCIEA